MIEVPNFKHNWSADFLKIATDSPVVRVFVPDFNENLDCSFCKKPVVSKKEVAIHFGMFFVHADCLKQIMCTYCRVATDIDKFQGSVDDHHNWICKKCQDSLVPCVYCKLKFLPEEIVDEHCRGCRVPCRTCNKKVGKKKLYKIKGVPAYCWNCAQRDIWVKPHDFNPLTILKFHGNPKNGLYFGVELELECADEPEAVKMAESLNKKFGKHLVVKHDGSLLAKGRAGLEVVTAPGDMDFHYKLWKDFFAQGYVYESERSSRCSTHIHMSKLGLRESQLARMAYFMFAPNNRQLVHLIAGRRLDNEWGEKYSRISPKVSIKDVVEVYGSRSYWKRETGNDQKEILDVLELPPNQRQLKYKLGPKKYVPPGEPGESTAPNKFDRYSALNVQNPNTAEMRIFCGTNSYEVMMKNLEFCQALISYCDIGRTAYGDLSKTESFIEFLRMYRSCYPNLISYLARKKHPSFPKKKKQVEIELKLDGNKMPAEISY